MRRRKMNLTFTEQLVFEECYHPYILQLTDEYRYFSLGFFIFEICYCIAGILLFLRKRNDEHVIIRTKYSFVLAILAFIANALNRSFMDYTLDEPSPFNSCNVFRPLGTLATGLIVCALTMRLLMYYNGYKLHKTVTLIQANSRDRTSTEKENIQKEISNLFYQTSDEFKTKLVCCFLFILMAYTLLQQINTCPTIIFPKTKCPGPDTHRRIVSYVFTITIFLFIFAIVANKTRKYPDPFNVLKELRIFLPVNFFFICFGAVIVTTYPPTREPTVPVAPPSISFTLAHFFNFTFLVIGPVFLSFKKKCIDLTLAQVLKCPNASKIFEKHMEREYSVENLHCYKAILRFEEMFETADTTTLSTIAKNIHRKFISMETADIPVNIVSFVRREVTAKIANNEISVGMFSDVKNCCLRFLTLEIFPRFKRSPYYALLIGLSDCETRTSLLNVI